MTNQWFGTMIVLAGAVMTSPRGISVEEATGVPMRCCSTDSGVTDFGVTGRASVVVVDENCDVVDGKIRDVSTGVVPVTEVFGCIVADGEMRMLGTASPNAPFACTNPTRSGGDGGSAKNAGFGSGMVMGTVT